jgi:hypothetical protein
VEEENMVEKERRLKGGKKKWGESKEKIGGSGK